MSVHQLLADPSIRAWRYALGFGVGLGMALIAAWLGGRKVGGA
jgi:hypothetical protein